MHHILMIISMAAGLILCVPAALGAPDDRYAEIGKKQLHKSLEIVITQGPCSNSHIPKSLVDSISKPVGTCTLRAELREAGSDPWVIAALPRIFIMPLTNDKILFKVRDILSVNDEEVWCLIDDGRGLSVWNIRLPLVKHSGKNEPEQLSMVSSIFPDWSPNQALLSITTEGVQATLQEDAGIVVLNVVTHGLHTVYRQQPDSSFKKTKQWQEHGS